MGCPLAAVAFDLTLHTALAAAHREIKEHDRGTHTMLNACMDDINLINHYNNLFTGGRALRDALNKLGLQVNEDKTECWVNPAQVPDSPTFNHIPRCKQPQVLKTTADPLPVTTVDNVPNQQTPPTAATRVLEKNNAQRNVCKHSTNTD